MNVRTRELSSTGSADILSVVLPLTVLPTLEYVTAAAKKSALDNQGLLEDSCSDKWFLSSRRLSTKNKVATVWSKLVQADQSLPASVTFRARTFAKGNRLRGSSNYVRDEDGSVKAFHDNLLDLSKPIAWRRQGVSQLDLIQVGSWSGLEPAIVTVDAVDNNSERAEELLFTAASVLLAFVSKET